jgi:hypothetical protein
MTTKRLGLFREIAMKRQRWITKGVGEGSDVVFLALGLQGFLLWEVLSIGRTALTVVLLSLRVSSMVYLEEHS